MSGSLFGTDGVRGKVGREPITPVTVMKLGWAAGTVFSEVGTGNQVLIGKDTRISGYLLESALEAGFSAAGMNISLIGPMPTPGIAYLTRTTGACAGVVISASHNPYYDNGIKFFSAQGTKLADQILEKIEARMLQPMECVDSSRLGKAERFVAAHERYIDYCKSTLGKGLNLSRLKVVVDCANGAAYEIAPRVFSELGAETIAIANQPNGLNINQQCGSTDLSRSKAEVIRCGADLGLALDGDADRVLLIDGMGNTIDGDQILYILSQQRMANGGLHGGVIGTVMSNLGLELALKRQSVPFVRTEVGDRHVYKALMAHDWRLGGETSGHIICLDKNSTGDGIVAALEVLEAMLATGQTLADLVQCMEVYPQHTINVPVGDLAGADLVKTAPVTDAIAQVTADLGTRGRVVLRPSGTEPLVRVMIEGEDRDEIIQFAQYLAGAVESTVL